jgi:predicted nucleotidyltransferase
MLVLGPRIKSDKDHQVEVENFGVMGYNMSDDRFQVDSREGTWMNRKLPIEIKETSLAEFCRKNYIQKLSFFGSVLRDDFGPRSDIDVLVEFQSGHIPGLFHLAGMEEELSELFKRKADLRTAEDLSPYFRQSVLNEAEVGYERYEG